MKKILFVLVFAAFSFQPTFASFAKAGKYLCSISKYHGTIFSSTSVDMPKPIDFSLPENQGNGYPPFGVAFAQNDKYVIYVNETAPANDPYPSQFVIYSVAKAQPQGTISMARGFALSHQSIDFIDGVSNADVTCVKQ